MSSTLENVKYLSQEISSGCNMREIHPLCPIHGIDIYALMDKRKKMEDEVILDNIKISYENGFNGFLNWFFYNEPLLEIDRLERISKGVYKINPNAKNVLWTNGSLIGNHVDPDRLSIFTHVFISNYAKKRWSELKSKHPNVTLLSGKLDNRMTSGPENHSGCRNMNGEIIIDFYGNWRMCCIDFYGTSVKMNVHTDGFQSIIDEWRRLSNLVAQTPQPDSVPKICGYCRSKKG